MYYFTINEWFLIFGVSRFVRRKTNKFLPKYPNK